MIERSHAARLGQHPQDLPSTVSASAIVPASNPDPHVPSRKDSEDNPEHDAVSLSESAFSFSIDLSDPPVPVPEAPAPPSSREISKKEAFQCV